MKGVKNLFKKKTKEVMYCIEVIRRDIPHSNITELTLIIETLPLPDEFVKDVGKLIVKYLR
jgi:hypothetical protein